MKKYRVYLNYYVECKAKGYMDVEAESVDEAISLAESLEGEIDNIELEEQEIIGDVEPTDVGEI